MISTLWFTKQFTLIRRQIGTCNVLRRKQFVRDPGVNRRIAILDKDDPMRHNIYDEEDINSLETDFSEVDQSMEELRRERRNRRKHVALLITKKKFFSGPKPPNMLTWAERQEIKKLHSLNPEEWNVDVLSECFPATRETLMKILKAKWQPESPDKMRRRDLAVSENWKRLEEGRLEADPEVLEHLRKFLGRKEEFLKSLGSGDYEKYFKKPTKAEKWNNGKMSSILESYERKLLGFHQAKMLDVGLEKGNNEVPLTLAADKTYDCKPNCISDIKLPTKGHITLDQLRQVYRNKIGLAKDEAALELSSKYQGPHLRSDKENLEVPEKSLPSMVSTSHEAPNVTLTNEAHNQVSTFQNPVDYNYKSDLEKQEFEKEEESIKGTFFWSDEARNSVPQGDDRQRIQAASKSFKRKVPGIADSAPPNRINVPKDKRGSGLTYQVKDCFYDDDGEFLYRVPGLDSLKKLAGDE